MQSRYSQLLAELRRGQAFLDTDWNVFITVNSGGARMALNEVTVELAGQAQSQSRHRTGRTGERRSEHKLARALRRQHIRPIVKVAKLTMPGIAQLDALRVPPEGSNNTELVTAALAIGDVVAPHHAELVAAGLPGDFLDGLRTAADGLLGAIAVKGGHFRQQVGATGAIDKTVIKSRRVVTAVDALTRAAVAEDDPILKEWMNIVRAIRRATNRVTKSEVTAEAQAGEVSESSVAASAGETRVTTTVPAAPAAEEVRSAA